MSGTAGIPTVHGGEEVNSPARPYALPEAEDARRVVAELQSTAERVADVHTFGKGLGIAAPQIGSTEPLRSCARRVATPSRC
jgi:hypothetical protein